MQLPPDLDETIRRALVEDLGTGDVTTTAVVPEGDMAVGRIVTKAPGVVAGAPVFERTLELLDDTIVHRWTVLDGSKVEAGRVLGEVRGPARSMLTGERVALNIPGIDLQVLGLPHGGFPSIQNLGHVVSLGGRKILHIGDADTNAETFRRLALERDGIDVALLPMWFLTEREGQAIVRNYIKPRRLVGIHLPASGYERAVASARAAFPDSDALTKLLELRRY